MNRVFNIHRRNYEIAMILKKLGFDVEPISKMKGYDILVNRVVKIDVIYTYSLLTDKTDHTHSFKSYKKEPKNDIYVLLALESYTENNVGDMEHWPDIYVIPAGVINNGKKFYIGPGYPENNVYLNNWDIVKKYVEFMEDDFR